MNGPVDRSYAELVEVATAAGTHRRSSRVGPLPVELFGDGDRELERIAGHLRSGSGPTWPPLRVTTVDSTSIPVDRIPIELRPVGRETLVSRGLQLTAVANGFEGSLWILDHDNAHAVRWVHDAHDLPYGELVSPLSFAIRWWAGTSSLGALVHAGAVAVPEGAVLLVGNSGAGKSTSVMACAPTDLEVLGDDQVLVEIDADGHPHAHPVYRLAKLTAASFDLLPAIDRDRASEGQQGKWLVELPADALPPRPVRAVCQVVQDPSGPTRIEPCSRADILKALGVSTLFQLAIAKRETWDVTVQLVRNAAALRLVVRHPDEVPAVLSAVLAGWRETSPASM